MCLCKVGGFGGGVKRDFVGRIVFGGGGFLRAGIRS